MPTFDYVGWGNALKGKWVLETGESGVYRGQCTQIVTQILKDLGYSGYNAARGNGNQVGPTMVIRGEAVFVGTDLSSIPSNEIHVICKDVGNFSTPGHVSVAAAGDVIYEQNIGYSGAPSQNFGVGPTYPVRVGRLSESWRGTRYHYKITVETDYDNVSGDGGIFEPDDPTGPNQNRFVRSSIFGVKKFKSAQINSIKNHKKYDLVQRTFRGIPQG